MWLVRAAGGRHPCARTDGFAQKNTILREDENLSRIPLVQADAHTPAYVSAQVGCHMPQIPDRDAFFVHRANTSLRRLGKQDIQRALIFDHTHRPDPVGGTEGGRQTSEPLMRAARVERTPLVAELLKSLGGQSALGVLSSSETGGKTVGGANRLPVAHIVAAKTRQKLKQSWKMCPAHAR